jgi:hypothetical protein
LQKRQGAVVQVIARKSARPAVKGFGFRKTSQAGETSRRHQGGRGARREPIEVASSGGKRRSVFLATISSPGVAERVKGRDKPDGQRSCADRDKAEEYAKPDAS